MSMAIRRSGRTPQQATESGSGCMSGSGRMCRRARRGGAPRGNCGWSGLWRRRGDRPGVGSRSRKPPMLRRAGGTVCEGDDHRGGGTHQLAAGSTFMSATDSDSNVPQPTARDRNQAEARRVINTAYPFRCCAVCGLQIETCLQIAHLASPVRGLCFADVRSICQLTAARVHRSAIPDGKRAPRRGPVLERRPVAKRDGCPPAP